MMFFALIAAAYARFRPSDPVPQVTVTITINTSPDDDPA
jgi:hypothetical protein